MKIKILRVEDNLPIDAAIVYSKNVKINLPSIVDGWRFNFKKHAKEVGFKTYILVCEDTPTIVEGCLIFEMKNRVEPYMAFVEVAPRNRGELKKFENVAGCLIAFACRLSFIDGNDIYRGWLAFDVFEENKEDEIKLMALYSKKYNALKFTETTMVIPPNGGEKLINEFLKIDYEK
ncbi:hypothetical protein [Flavobacterium filum]|uniref:hypothetical protein n=2 Tax=Flavobacteriaceae TaxID=49546 RepID=UPI000400809E|nr:hypothetical protein [Flavobacterium filum]